MFRHRDGDAAADGDGDGNGVEAGEHPIPTAAQRAELLKSGKAVVGVIDAVTSAPQDDTTVWQFAVTYAEEKRHHTVRFGDELPNRFQFTVGSHVPIRVERSTAIVDDVHLASRMSQESSLNVAPGQVVRMEDLPRMVIGAPQPKRWKLPVHCPNCGGPVDQAVQSEQTDPRCGFCEQPLPVE